MDIPYALYFGVGICIFTVVIQSQYSATYSIAQAGQEDRLLNSKVYDVLGFKNPKIAIFRMESSLYFATADRFKRKLYNCTVNPKKFRRPRDDVEIVIKHNAGYVSDEMSPPPIGNGNNEIPSGKMFNLNADSEGKAYRRIDLTTSPSDVNSNDTITHGKRSFANGNVDDKIFHKWKANFYANDIEGVRIQTRSGSIVRIDIVRDNYATAPPLTHVIIDCSFVNNIDLNGSKVLAQIVYEFKEIGIAVLFGNCTNYMRNYIEISTLKDKIEKKCIYADIVDAYYAASMH